MNPESGHPNPADDPNLVVLKPGVGYEVTDERIIGPLPQDAADGAFGEEPAETQEFIVPDELIEPADEGGERKTIRRRLLAAAGVAVALVAGTNIPANKHDGDHGNTASEATKDIRLVKPHGSSTRSRSLAPTSLQPSAAPKLAPKPKVTAEQKLPHGLQPAHKKTVKLPANLSPSVAPILPIETKQPEKPAADPTPVETVSPPIPEAGEYCQTLDDRTILAVTGNTPDEPGEDLRFAAVTLDAGQDGTLSFNPDSQLGESLKYDITASQDLGSRCLLSLSDSELHTTALLGSGEQAGRFVDSLLPIIDEYGFDGVNLDYSNAPEAVTKQAVLSAGAAFAEAGGGDFTISLSPSAYEAYESEASLTQSEAASDSVEQQQTEDLWGASDSQAETENSDIYPDKQHDRSGYDKKSKKQDDSNELDIPPSDDASGYDEADQEESDSGGMFDWFPQTDEKTWWPFTQDG